MKFRLAIVVAIAIALLTLMPLPDDGVQMPVFDGADKLIHAVMFGVLALAIIWDWVRSGCGFQLDGRKATTAVVVVSIYGGLIELLQSVMGEGRSGDLYDWIADDAGAILAAGSCYVLMRIISLNRFLEIEKVGMVNGKYGKIYVESFPPEERRPWNEIVRFAGDCNHPLNFYEIKVFGMGVGFITAWKLGEWTYVEHFAIDPCRRGQGLGKIAIEKFCVKHSPVVLEVEPDGSSKDAARRIKFYKLCGFIACEEYEYVQPSYGPGLPEVTMMIMTYGGGCANLDKLNELLRKYVYRV